jgi:hypothetical protein
MVAGGEDVKLFLAEHRANWHTATERFGNGEGIGLNT